MAIIGNNTRNDGNTSLDCEMEGALFEGQQTWFLGIAASALGKHIDALPLGLYLIGSPLHCLARILAVLTIDEDGATERHEPSKERRLLEGSLGRDAAVLGEHGTQHQNVELGLVISNKDGGSSISENVLRVVDYELYAGGVAHDEPKRASDEPLGDLLLAEEGEGDGGNSAEKGAEEERDVTGEDSSDEGGLGNGE